MGFRTIPKSKIKPVGARPAGEFALGDGGGLLRFSGCGGLVFCKHCRACFQHALQCLSPVPVDRESPDLRTCIYRTAGSYGPLLQFLGFELGGLATIVESASRIDSN